MPAFPIRSAGPMPAMAKPSVIFDFAIGGHADLIDWWTIAPDFVTLASSDIAAVVSRKLSADGDYAGRPLAAILSAPQYLEDQINGRPAASFAASSADRLEVPGILPGGSFSVSLIFDVPAIAPVSLLAGSQNNGGVGRFAAYVRQIGGTDYIVATAGNAGSDAVVSIPRALGKTHAVISWDANGHELAMSLNGGAFTAVSNGSAVVTQTGLALGSYAGQGGSLDGLIADAQLWNVALHRPANAGALDLVRRYGRSAYAIG